MASDATGGRPRRITALDVARRAGVSRSAVSRAFSRTAYIDPGKRALILKVAEEMGYRPNALAAGLMRTRSNLVAVVAGEIGNFHDAALVAQLVPALIAAGKWPIVIDGSVDAEELGAPDIFSYPLDAMIVRGGSVDETLVAACAKLNIPLVFSGCIVEADFVDSVCCLNAGGMGMAADLLVQRGRRRFGYIGGPSSWASERERFAGARARLRTAGLEFVACLSADYTFEGGSRAARDLLSAQQLDAVICANDAMALGALTVARQEMGLAVPVDLSITGFDDIGQASWPCFNLTTLRNPVDTMVARIVDLLLTRLAYPTLPGRVAHIEPDLIARDTH